MQGPIGMLSLAFGVLAAVIGYVLSILGVTLYFNLNALPPEAITNTESIIVFVIGLVMLAVAYAGWRGFMSLGY
jgi:hypothetical protein